MSTICIAPDQQHPDARERLLALPIGNIECNTEDEPDGHHFYDWHLTAWDEADMKVRWNAIRFLATGNIAISGPDREAAIAVACKGDRYILWAEATS